MLLRLSLTTTFTPTHSRNHMTCTNAGLDVETQHNCESAKLVETRGNWEKACRNAGNGENVCTFRRISI